MVHITDWLPTLIRVAGGDLNDYPELQRIDGIDQVLLIIYKLWYNNAKLVHKFLTNHMVLV